MKLVLIAALALSLAAPVAVSFAPTSAEAQVMANRGAQRNAARHRRPALSQREEDRLYAAQEALSNIDQQIADIQAQAQGAGGLTPAQQAAIQQHEAAKAQHQAVVDRLEAKRNRHG